MKVFRRGRAWVILAFVLFHFVGGAEAIIVTTPWLPIFKGVDRSIGTNFPSTIITNHGVTWTNSTLQVVNCVRVDLLDPDVQFFTSPRATNYIPESSETYSGSVSNFVKRYGVQVASVANFYQTFYNGTWGADAQFDGLPSRIFGLSICTGQVVSVPDFGPDSNNRYASLLFTTNKTPFLVQPNAPPGTNTTGIYTAVSGYYAVVTNGVIIGTPTLSAKFPDPTFHLVQPRTLFGLSADRRYFYMMVIDGRQGLSFGVNPPYSDGADDTDSAIWLVQFGASDGIAMDGGGSAAMYMENCSGGNPLPLGHSSYVSSPPNRERITGSLFGVYALPLPGFINDVIANPAVTSATVTWTTLSNASSQVQYGLTSSLESFSEFDETLTTNHSVTLSGLMPGTRYYYRVLSSSDGETNFSQCPASLFITTNFASGVLIPLTKNWKYQTANLDGVNWTAPDYNDTAWPNGPACLWADSRSPVQASYTNAVPNFATGTRMPINSVSTYPFITYYFRTSFTYSQSMEGLTLTFSNFLDDGAIFYLNGYEVFRTNMPAGPVDNDTATPANCPCPFAGSFSNNATCPMVFTLSGNALINLVVGTNIIAVEVHDYRPGNPSPDVAFESAVHFTLPPPPPPPPFITSIVFVPGETNAVVTWSTLSNSTSQVLYGLTPALGLSNTLDENLVSNHAMVLNGLEPMKEYYVRIVSTRGTNLYSGEGIFTTTSFFAPLVTDSNLWRFSTENLSGVSWFAPAYDDSDWSGQGTALLYVEDNSGVSPRNTLLPSNAGVPYSTYYFRTHFDFAGVTTGYTLLFTNFIDDGAVFYLNGREIQRVRMNAGPISYTSFANGCPVNMCEATLDAPDIFRLGSDAMTNLLTGDNVLAVEVHQFAPSENDVVFGSTVGLVRALASETRLHIQRSDNVVCVSWKGLGLTLQQANGLTGVNLWSDAPGPITSSPYCITNPVASTFFRLRD